TKNIVVDGYKGGSIKIKYNPSQSNAKFNYEPISISRSNSDVNHVVTLTGLELYESQVNVNKFLNLTKGLKFDSITKFERLIDITDQLGSLVIGKKNGNSVTITDVIPLKEVKIKYSTPIKYEEASILEKSTVSNLKLSIPVYGSIESLMSNSDLNYIKWGITYYPMINNTSITTAIEE
ncbi:hypothetical protein D0809_25215, partial [Flavobacterium circumlabens]